MVGDNPTSPRGQTSQPDVAQVFPSPDLSYRVHGIHEFFGFH